MNVRLLLACFVVALISGCGASSFILVGEVRPEIRPEQVRIYLHPPANYEEVAIIEATNLGGVAFTEQGRTQIVVERLKKQAAAIGANGILWGGMSNQSAGSFTTATATATGNTAYGTGITTNAMYKRGNALAIYVTDGTIPPDVAEESADKNE